MGDLGTQSLNGVSGFDFVEVFTNVTFAPFISHQNVTLQIVDDQEREMPESFIVFLYDPQGAILRYTDDTATIHILDDDGKF